MSRIRTIRPEFWTSEQVISCSLNARLLFIGLWNFCDDNGIHTASYVRIKAEIFPGDSVQILEIQIWINELIQNGLILEYIVDEKSYWVVTGWKKHQKIERPTPRHPLPQFELKKITNNLMSTRREITEYSSTNCRNLDDSSPPERKVKEGSVMELNTCEVVTSLPRDIGIDSSADIEVFEYWQKIMSHPNAKLDKKRKQAINKSLQIGYSIDDLKKAIDGCANSDFHMGKNDHKQIYDDISLILRDADHIEKFIRNGSPGNTGGANWMLEVI